MRRTPVELYTELESGVRREAESMIGDRLGWIKDRAGKGRGLRDLDSDYLKAVDDKHEELVRDAMARRGEIRS
jgi:hypothetical protein